METTKRCPHCGATLPEGSLYCFKCGTKLEILDDSDINYSQFANNANTSVDPQDQNIPIDDLLGQTHVINSLMSELDDIVKGDGTDLPVMPSVKQVKDEEPVMPSTPVEKPAKQVNKVEETSPFAWEIPSFLLVVMLVKKLKKKLSKKILAMYLKDQYYPALLVANN